MMRLIPFAVAAGLIASPVQAQEKLTVVLDWFVNPDHAPLIVAQQTGLFEKHGLEVELIPPADASAPPRMVAAGQADIAITYQPNLHLQVAEGLPLVRIGTLVDTPLNALVSLEGGEIETIADLKGGTVGYSVGGFEEALLGAMLKDAGLEMDDVTTVNVNFALTPALMTGQVDAVIGAFRNFEMTQISLAGGEGRAFFPEEHGVPLYDELIYVVNREALDDERLPSFLDAVQEATIQILNHPDESWESFIAAHAELDDELNRQAWRDTLPRLAKSPAVLDEARYRRFGAFMREVGLIEATPALEDYAVEIGGE